ncbi:MAG: hypothetical protein KJO07_11905 [Deltaproteobacteria bacterium]|nr:hypothetical protein [Deltaproteobacteria bacterium]
MRDLLTRRRKSFSLLANRWRHVAGAFLRLAFIIGAYIAVDAGGWPAMPAYLGAAFVGGVLIALSDSDRCLRIDPDTGLVTWTKMTFPWFSDPLNVAFVDACHSLHYDDDRYLKIFGIAELERFWTVSYNGSDSTSGSYTKRRLRKIAKQVNAYLGAFRRHDSDEGRAAREAFRKAYRARIAPIDARRRERRERSAKRARAREAAAKARKERRAARKRSSRQADMDAKFG